MSKFKFQILNLLIVCCIASSTNTFDIVQLTQDPFHEYASLTTSNTINSNAQVIKVKQGSKVKLECSFDYYYSPPQSQQQIADTNEFSSTDGIENSNIYKMLWLKENKGVIAINNEVKYNKEKYSIETTSTNTLNLIIDHVDTSDNGKYICQHFDFSNLKLYLIIVLGEYFNFILFLNKNIIKFYHIYSTTATTANFIHNKQSIYNSTC